MAGQHSSNASGDERAMLVAYRHDAHKLLGEPHAHAAESVAGICVNQQVPLHADRDAAALSRPSGEPELIVDGYCRPYRLSLLEPQSRTKATNRGHQVKRRDIERLLGHEDPETMHRAWLTTDVASRFSESVHAPYTSLKYHTLLVAALLDNYRAGQEFADLYLVVDPPEKIVSHRTICAGNRFALRLDADADNPTARLGSQPWRSWAGVWSRLREHPLATDEVKRDMLLDANLRRISAWSTALQYIENFEERINR